MSATQPPAPDDDALAARFAAIEPAPAAIVRMGASIEARLARLARPLWREWLELVVARPVVSPALAAAAFAFVLFTTPAGIAVGLLARALAATVPETASSASLHGVPPSQIAQGDISSGIRHAGRTIR